MQTEHLQNFFRNCEQGRTKCKLIDVRRTRWISRTDDLEVFEEFST